MDESQYWLSEGDRRRAFAKYWLHQCRMAPTAKDWALRAISAVRQAERNTAADGIASNDAAEIIRQAYGQWMQHHTQQRSQLMIESQNSHQQMAFAEQVAIAAVQGLTANPAIIQEFNPSLANGWQAAGELYSTLVATIASDIARKMGGSGDGSS